MKRIIVFILIIIFSTLYLPPPVSHAGIIDKIKAIINTPEKVDEMINQYEVQYEQTKQQFEDTKRALEEQQQKYKEAEQRATEYARQQEELQALNERYLSDNKQLLTQNTELTQRLSDMEQQQSERNALIRKLIIMGITVIGLILGYFALIRVWRYFVWRRHHADQRGHK